MGRPEHALGKRPEVAHEHPGYGNVVRAALERAADRDHHAVGHGHEHGVARVCPLLSGMHGVAHVLVPSHVELDVGAIDQYGVGRRAHAEERVKLPFRADVPQYVHEPVRRREHSLKYAVGDLDVPAHGGLVDAEYHDQIVLAVVVVLAHEVEHQHVRRVERALAARLQCPCRVVPHGRDVS